ncbi:hypothetical protein [Chishuiella sp.]|uniref:hypothetical protein n=1 Tax=Chishuiella sp. TaxID=1969467 RepID=UPI0028AAAF83|nr:hypothetical protein [Chishuiella sp.]
MKKIMLFVLTLVNGLLFAQVGINTDQPTKTLDVNGEVRIRKIEELNSTPTYVLVPSDSGIVSKILASSISSSTNDSSYYNNGISKTAIVATGSSSNTGFNGTANTTAFTTRNKIPLTAVQYEDSKLITFDVSNSTFVVNKSAYYSISIEATIQARTSGGGTTALYIANNSSNTFVTGTTNYSEGDTTYPSYTSIVYLEKDVIYSIRAFHTRSYYIRNGKFYLSILTTNNE